MIMKIEFRSNKGELLRLALHTVIVSGVLFTVLFALILMAEYFVALLLVEIIPEDIAKIIGLILLPLMVSSLISYILLRPTKLWLYSIPVQLAVYSLLWWLLRGNKGWDWYVAAMLFVFAGEAIGVGIRLLVIKLKKCKSKPKPTE